MKKWVKLDLFYLGKSKKNEIFRTKKWIRGKDEIIFKKPVFDENYEKIGYIKEIFGPIELPFISIKTIPDKELNPTSILYAKV